jgi:hypothetical protein
MCGRSVDPNIAEMNGSAMVERLRGAQARARVAIATVHRKGLARYKRERDLSLNVALPREGSQISLSGPKA